jgi:predicted CXXCH cytochrome family protein
MIKRSKVTVIIIIILYALDSRAGTWHQSSQLVCSDCHTMHYSERGTRPEQAQAGGPFPKLLMARTVNNLCLSCHDGTNTDAPDVIASVTYTPDPVGGYFANSGGIASNKGHDLGMALGKTPPGGTDSMILSCASCHDPHGNSNYRNLLLNPKGSANNADVNVVATQTKVADGPGGNRPADVYNPSNIVYRSGMSEWCNDCHNNFHGTSETGSPEPWFRHPQDVTINGSTHADYSHWSGTILNRVRVQSPNDTTIPSTDDRVFCLSCHKAHGSSNKNALIYTNGSNMLPTCQQCHNQ